MSRSLLFCLVVVASVCLPLGCGGGGGSSPGVGMPVIERVNPVGLLGVPGGSVTFEAEIANGPQEWRWNFGNGAVPNTSTERTPTVQLPATGDFNGLLIASNVHGDSAPFQFEFSVQESVAAPVIASVVPRGIVALPGGAVTFRAQAGNAPTSWTWDFGGGATPNTSTEAEPAVTAGAAGTYSGVVIASNANGDSTPFEFEYEISTAMNAPVILSVTPSGTVGAPGDTVTFAVESQQGATSWEWTFPPLFEPSESAEESPSVRLPGPGTYTAEVIATNAVGSSLPFRFEFTVGPEALPPAITWVQPSDVAGTPGSVVEFRAIVENNPIEWEWHFGFGAEPNVSNAERPVVTLGVSRTYEGTLRARNAEGSSTPFHFTYQIGDRALPPDALFLTNPQGMTAPAGTEVAVSVVTSQIANTWEWMFDGGASPNTTGDETPTVTLGPEGYYQGIVRAANDRGFGRGLTFGYSVSPAPLDGPTVHAVSPTGLLGDVGDAMVFSTISSNGADAWSWDFGVGITPRFASGAEPTVTLFQPGTHSGQVIAASPTGVSEPFEFSYEVAALPGTATITAVSPDGAVAGDEWKRVTFTATADGPVDRWIWDFGGGAQLYGASGGATADVLLGSARTYEGHVAAENASGIGPARAFSFTVTPETGGWVQSIGPDPQGIGVPVRLGVAVRPDGVVISAGARPVGRPTDYDAGPGIVMREGFGFLLATTPEGRFLGVHMWEFGVSSLDVRVDAQNRTYVLGAWNGGLRPDLDPGPGVERREDESAQHAIAIFRFDASGVFERVGLLGGITANRVHDWTVDDAGRVYLVGIASEAFDLDPGTGVQMGPTLDGTFVPFALALDENGDLAWANFWQDADSLLFWAIAAQDDRVVVAGGLSVDDVDPGPGVEIRGDGTREPIILSLSASEGAFQEAVTFSNPTTATPRAFGLLGRPDGGLVVVCDGGDGSLDFGTFTQFVEGTFVVGLDSSLGAETVRDWSPELEVSDWAVDSAGRVYLYGGFDDPVVFDPEGSTPTTPDREDLYLIRLDAEGSYDGAMTWGGIGRPLASKLAISGEFVFLTGGFYREMDFDPGPGSDSRFGGEGPFETLDFLMRLPLSGAY